jgi:ribosomal protein L35
MPRMKTHSGAKKRYREAPTGKPRAGRAHLSSQLEAVYSQIERRRVATEYLDAPAVLVEP